MHQRLDANHGELVEPPLDERASAPPAPPLAGGAARRRGSRSRQAWGRRGRGAAGRRSRAPRRGSPRKRWRNRSRDRSGAALRHALEGQRVGVGVAGGHIGPTQDLVISAPGPLGHNVLVAPSAQGHDTVGRAEDRGTGARRRHAAARASHAVGAAKLVPGRAAAPGPAKARLSASTPPALDDGVAEALAGLVLAQLHVEAEQAFEHPHQRRAVAGGGGPAPRAARRGSGSASAPAASMTCSAWPSITAIVAWTRSSDRAALGPTAAETRPSLAQALDDLAQRVRGRPAGRARGRRSGTRARSAARAAARRRARAASRPTRTAPRA